jgi:hypothetical protein
MFDVSKPTCSVTHQPTDSQSYSKCTASLWKPFNDVCHQRDTVSLTEGFEINSWTPTGTQNRVLELGSRSQTELHTTNFLLQPEGSTSLSKPILRQDSNPVPSTSLPKNIFMTTVLTLSSHILSVRSGRFPKRFRIKILHAFLTSPTRYIQIASSRMSIAQGRVFGVNRVEDGQ